MDEQQIDVKQEVSESSTETQAETVPQDVKLEEKPEILEESLTKPAPQGIPYERFREVNDRLKATEEKLKEIQESSISSDKLAELPDFDLMTDTERYLAKELIQLKEKAKWEEDLNRAKKTFPALAGKEAEFKDYCYKFPKSVDVEVLSKSFLFDNKPPVVEPVMVETKKGLERPTGGSRQAPAPGLTLEEISRLRENQPRVYEKMLREGKLPKHLSDLK